MNLKFKNLTFKIVDGQIRLDSGFGLSKISDENVLKAFPLVEIQIAGENHDAHCGAKQLMSSEGMKLKYANHQIYENELIIEQKSDFVLVKTFFESYNNTNAIRVHNEITNISENDIILEQANTLSLTGFGLNGIDSSKELYLHKFTNSWHVECQIQTNNFFDLGLYRANIRSLKRISGCNTGSWSTKEELPQAIIEDRRKEQYFMFQIESSGSWYWEIGENAQMFYLNMGGPNQQFNQWSKRLAPNEKYITVSVAVCTGKSINDIISEMTKYRRNIVKKCSPFSHIPTIFNEYMHASWDSPSEENTKIMAPIAAKLGIEYYVIDCGWHDEEDLVYPYVGKWQESKKRFPGGIKKTINFIHSLGMKAGLWLEIEAVGYLCQEMISYYGDDCFFHRNGKKILTMGRHQLDFRNPRARGYIEDVFKRLIEEYKTDYIKIDYNQCSGPGTETNSDSLGDGLQEHTRAYLSWMNEIMDKYPQVVFESCASGGQRMDYATLEIFPLQSTSDQTDYRKYPYIAGNITSAVLPEQAAVWSYPITQDVAPADVSLERIAMNMINSFLGCMHLASRIEKLSNEQLEIIKEGITYFNKLSKHKNYANPYFPLGWTGFDKSVVASGLIADKILYLAVWNLEVPKSLEGEVTDSNNSAVTSDHQNSSCSNDQKNINILNKIENKTCIIPIHFKGYKIKNAAIVYPSFSKTVIDICKNEIRVHFENINMARFIEIEFE